MAEEKRVYQVNMNKEIKENDRQRQNQVCNQILKERT